MTIFGQCETGIREPMWAKGELANCAEFPGQQGTRAQCLIAVKQHCWPLYHCRLINLTCCKYFHSWPSLIPHQALMEKSWFAAMWLASLMLATARLLKFKLFLRKSKWLHLSEFACSLVVGATLNIVKNVALKGFSHANHETWLQKVLSLSRKKIKH